MPETSPPLVYNFVKIGYLGSQVVYFGVGLTKEEALEQYRKDHPDMCEPEEVGEFQAVSRFAVYDAWAEE